MGLYSACAISDSTHKSRCNVIAQHLRSFWHHRQVTSQYDCTALALFLTPQTSHVAMRLYSACTLSDSTDKSRCNGIVQCLRYFWQHRQVTSQYDCTALALFLTPQTSHVAMQLYSACALSDSTDKSRCNAIVQRLRSFWHHRQVTSQYDCTVLALFPTPQTSHVAIRLYTACIDHRWGITMAKKWKCHDWTKYIHILG